MLSACSSVNSMKKGKPRGGLPFGFVDASQLIWLDGFGLYLLDVFVQKIFQEFLFTAGNGFEIGLVG